MNKSRLVLNSFQNELNVTEKNGHKKECEYIAKKLNRYVSMKKMKTAQRSTFVYLGDPDKCKRKLIYYVKISLG